MTRTRRYLARIGACGGRKSRRNLSPEAARAMVCVRETKRAYRRFHAQCFASAPFDLAITAADVPWVVAQLLEHGGPEGRAVGDRLRAYEPLERLEPLARLTPLAPAASTHMLDDVRRIRALAPEDRLREVANISRFVAMARRA